MTVYLDSKRLNLPSFNKSYGNKILHLYYAIAICERHKLDLAVPDSSDLGDIFDLKRVIKPYPLDIVMAFEEDSAFVEPNLLAKILRKLDIGFYIQFQSIEDAKQRSEYQYSREMEFLNAGSPIQNFYVRGHFWHFGLMPSASAVNRWVNPRNELLAYVERTYPDIQNDEVVAVHLRGADFSNHLRHVFKESIGLDRNYYHNAVEVCEKELGKNITYHMFTDDESLLKDIFKDRKTVVHRDAAAVDWVALRQSKKVIQSNSTFCWTASLHNKNFNIQPYGGYNYKSNSGNIPYGFIMPGSFAIKADGSIKRP